MPFMWIVYLVIAIVAIAMAPKQKFVDAKPAGMGDFDFPTADNNRAVPVLMGTQEIRAPNNIWAGDMHIEPMEETVDGGMFHSDTTYIVGYKYYIGMQFALCYGVVDSFTRLRVEDKIAFNGNITTNADFVAGNRSLFGGEDQGGGYHTVLKFYNGSNSQLADPYLNSVISGQVPSYRGICYIIQKGWKGSYSVLTGWATKTIAQYYWGRVSITPYVGGSVGMNVGRFIPVVTSTTITYPIYTYVQSGYVGINPSLRPLKFTVTRQPNPLLLTGNKHKIGLDANPANCMYDILTDQMWGMGLATSLIDEVSFRTAGNTLYDEGFGVSFLWDSERAVKDILEDIIRHIEAVLIMNYLTGKLELRLIRSTYDANAIPAFDDSSIVSLDNYTRGDWRSTLNETVVTFTDRRDNYQPNTTSVNDSANSMVQNRYLSRAVDYYMVTSEVMANKLAWRSLKSLGQPIASFSVKLNRQGHNIMVGDPIKISYEPLGITSLIVRVLEAKYGTHANGEISLKCVQDVFSLQDSVFADPPISGGEPLSQQPVPATDWTVLHCPDFLNVSRAQVDMMLLVGRSSDSQIGVVRAESTSSNHLLFDSPRQRTTPFAKLAAALPMTGKWDEVSTPIVVNLPVDVQGVLPKDTFEVAAGYNLCFIEDGSGGEFISFCGIDTSDSGVTYTLSRVYRGLMGTPMRPHPAGSKIWFVSYGYGRKTGLAVGQHWYKKILPETSYGKLSRDSVALIDTTVSFDAQWKPYVVRNWTVAGYAGSLTRKRYAQADHYGVGGAMDFTCAHNSFGLNTLALSPADPLSQDMTYHWRLCAANVRSQPTTSVLEVNAQQKPIMVSADQSKLAGSTAVVSLTVTRDSLITWLDNPATDWQYGNPAMPPTLLQMICWGETVEVPTHHSLNRGYHLVKYYPPYEVGRADNQGAMPKGELFSVNGKLIGLWTRYASA